MINIILTDLDGTILDNRLRIYKIYYETLLANAFQPLELEVFWKMKRERTGDLRILTESGAASCSSDYSDRAHEKIEHPDYLLLDTVIPGVREKLVSWQNDGLRVIIVTNRRNKESLLEQFAKLELQNYFNSIVLCDPSAGPGGKARAVRTQISNITPEDCVWIGDTEADIEGAREFKCPIIAVTSGIRSEAFLAKLKPDYICADLQSIDLKVIP